MAVCRGGVTGGFSRQYFRMFRRGIKSELYIML